MFKEHHIPRGMRRKMAAYYLGISVSQFDKMKRQGLLPTPKKILNCDVYDSVDLDKFFDDQLIVKDYIVVPRDDSPNH